MNCSIVFGSLRLLLVEPVMASDARPVAGFLGTSVHTSGGEKCTMTLIPFETAKEGGKVAEA